MPDRIQHFLLVFDHASGRLLELQEFAEHGAEAVKAYSAKEKELGENRDVEIVLVGSDSLETVKLTHANYFDGSVAVSRFLAGI